MTALTREDVLPEPRNRLEDVPCAADDAPHS